LLVKLADGRAGGCPFREMAARPGGVRPGESLAMVRGA